MLLAFAPSSEETTLGSNQMVGPLPAVPAGRTAGRLAHSPQAFLVKNAPGRRTNVHYHPVDQFHVFTGTGRIGRHAIGSLSVHYADRYQPYGPIIAGSGGLSYLTVRAWSDCGIFYLPESRDALAAAGADPPPRRRNLSFDLGKVTLPMEWAWLADEADGLRVGVCNVSAGPSVSLPAIGGDGAWVVVLSGVLAVRGAELGQGSAIFVGADESDRAVAIPAGGGAAGLALLQFPQIGSI
jgi:hypothetical protein